FEIYDVNRLPLLRIEEASDVYRILEQAFSKHEAHRECSPEFRKPGPSSWAHAQSWAQRAINKMPGIPLPQYQDVFEPESKKHHLSYAVGVAMGRFGTDGAGILRNAPPLALPNGILYVSPCDEGDSIDAISSHLLRDVWDNYPEQMDSSSIREW